LNRWYALIVDGQKKEFDTQDRALKMARELKGRFPNLQVKVFDAERKQSEAIELARNLTDAAHAAFARPSGQQFANHASSST
jgi:hypothetical protein